jgi:hypothetical protein
VIFVRVAAPAARFVAGLRPIRSSRISQYTRAGVRFVRGGTLDDPSSIAPDVHIYTRSKLSWVTLPESVPAVATYYDTESSGRRSLERLADSRVTGA